MVLEAAAAAAAAAAASAAESAAPATVRGRNSPRRIKLYDHPLGQPVPLSHDTIALT
jgi:hypothetical protein